MSFKLFSFHKANFGYMFSLDNHIMVVTKLSISKGMLNVIGPPCHLEVPGAEKVLAEESNMLIH